MPTQYVISEADVVSRKALNVKNRDQPQSQTLCLYTSYHLHNVSIIKLDILYSGIKSTKSARPVDGTPSQSIIGSATDSRDYLQRGVVCCFTHSDVTVILRRPV